MMRALLVAATYKAAAVLTRLADRYAPYDAPAARESYLHDVEAECYAYAKESGIALRAVCDVWAAPPLVECDLDCGVCQTLAECRSPNDPTPWTARGNAFHARVEAD